MDINAIIAQNDGRPATDPLPAYIEQWLGFTVNIPTGNTADIDLNTGAIQSTDPYWDQWFGSADTPDLILHCERLFVDVVDANFGTLDIDEKDKLVKGLQLEVRQSGKDYAYNVGQYIRDPWASPAITEATASDGEFAQYQGLGQFELPRPIRLNLANDRLNFAFSEAAPTVTGGIDVRLMLYAFVFRSDDVSKASRFAISRGGKTAVIEAPQGRVCSEVHGGFDKASGSKAARRMLGRKG
jgi:hypothetical protein